MKKNELKAHRKLLYELLKQIRIEKGLRQVDLAKKLGQPQSFISKYESGERRLDVVELRQVCNALGIAFDQFIRRFEDSIP